MQKLAAIPYILAQFIDFPFEFADAGVLQALAPIGGAVPAGGLDDLHHPKNYDSGNCYPCEPGDVFHDSILSFDFVNKTDKCVEDGSS